MLNPGSKVYFKTSGLDESRVIPIRVLAGGDSKRVMMLDMTQPATDDTRVVPVQAVTSMRAIAAQIQPLFALPLGDLGSGAVDTTPVRAALPTATFTRATAAAARLSTGLWKLDVATGVARSHYWDYTPGSGVYTYGGFISEGAATQILTAPRDMTNAAWTATNVTVAQTGTGIDGVVNSCSRLTCTTNGGTVLQTITAAATTRTYSCFIRRVTGSGTITIQQGATTLDVTASLTANGFALVQLPASVLNSVIGIVMGTSGDVILVDCNQFESGAFATTPIPAAGTRNADVLTYTFSGNADATQGTCYADCASFWSTAPASVPIFVGLGTAAANSPLTVSGAAADTTMNIRDGTTVVQKAALTSMFTGVRKRASAWGGVTMAVTGDGATVQSGAFDGDIGSSGIGIGIRGDGGGSQAYGTIQNVVIWAPQFPNTALQTMTGN